MRDTIDGRVAENAEFDCVPASIAAGLQYLNGIHYSPDALKDSAYGEAYANQGTAASAFVPYCLAVGVTLTKLPHISPYAAISNAHIELARGHPVLFTQQDDYAPAHPDWTHVCVWYKDTAATLTAMDPYGGKAITFSDLTWAARLRSNELWIMEVHIGSMLDILGHVPLFLGVETDNWTLDDFTAAAHHAKTLGCTSLLIKIADGGNLWYGGLQGWPHVFTAVNAVGIHAIPYTYCYGNTYGALTTEITILTDALRHSGIVIADMEEQYDGQAGWAQTVCNAVKPVPGIFGVTTWANPNDHRWQGVLSALKPCVNFWMPQVYSDNLARVYHAQYDPYDRPYYPVLNLGVLPGTTNDILAIAKSAKSPIIALWEYGPAMNAYTSVTKHIVSLFPSQAQEESMYHFLTIAEQASWFGQTVAGQDDRWTCKQNGVILGGLHLRHFRWNGGVATHGLPKTAEIQVDAKAHPEVTDVKYERCVMRYDPNYLYDHPPIDPDQPTKLVYPVRLDDTDAFALIAGTQINTLTAQVASLEAQLAALQGDAPAQTIATLEAKIAQVAALAEQAVTLLKA